MAAMLRGAWSESRFEVERFLDAGDRVVVFVRVIARGRGSGVPIELPDAHLVTLGTSHRVYSRLPRSRRSLACPKLYVDHSCGADKPVGMVGIVDVTVKNAGRHERFVQERSLRCSLGSSPLAYPPNGYLSTDTLINPKVGDDA